MLVRLFFAGLLALPALLLSLVLLPLQLLLSLPSVWLLLWDSPPLKGAANNATPTDQIKRQCRHVIVTGGSSGIGRAVALQAARQGDRVTIVARDTQRLAAAKQYIEDTIQQERNGQQQGEKYHAMRDSVDITVKSVNVTDYAALERLARELFAEDKTQNTSTHVFVCAGQAEPQYFQKIPPDSFQRQAHLNLLGSSYTARAFLPHLVPPVTNGPSQTPGASLSTRSSPYYSTMTFCSSMAGQVGVFGYGAYSPTKFALRGLAEVLSIEYFDAPIHFQVAYPPDTHTPGYLEENKTKPLETVLVSGGSIQNESTAAQEQPHAHAHDPFVIGRQMYQAAVATNPKSHVYFDFDGFLLATLCCGFGPVTTLLDGLAQVCGMQLVRWIALFYLTDWKRMLSNFRMQCQQQGSVKIEDKEVTYSVKTDAKVD